MNLDWIVYDGCSFWLNIGSSKFASGRVVAKLEVIVSNAACGILSMESEVLWV